MGEGSFWLSVWEDQTIEPREAWQQELEASGHIASTLRKQEQTGSGTRLQNLRGPTPTLNPLLLASLYLLKTPQLPKTALLNFARGIAHWCLPPAASPALLLPLKASALLSAFRKFVLSVLG